MESKIQKEIVDYFSFFEEFYNTSKACLKNCQDCAISINKLIKRCNNIQEAELTGTPLESFEDLQYKLSGLLHNKISLEILEIRSELSKVEDLFEKLLHKHQILLESCRTLDLEQTTSLIRGTPLQPPLKQLLEFAEDSFSFGNSILSSMQKPPAASEAQKDAMKKQKEAMERRKKEEKMMLNKFRRRVEEKVANFVKDGTKPHLQFDPMEQMYRAIIREIAETAGLQVFSFGQEGIDRYAVVYTKEKGPTQDELTVRREGRIWDEEKAAEMAQRHLEMQKQAALEHEEDNNKKRKRGKDEISGMFYKDKYAHLIGHDAAINAAQKTNMNKSYGEVPSENKKDQRSIEQTMADIRAKKMKKTDTDQGGSENVQI
ncbi:hypothetical protein evm_007994 [Chilo suppressalis]|nr:hypothetical protein evm_007994 [Chilo suppressalis]